MLKRTYGLVLLCRPQLDFLFQMTDHDPRRTGPQGGVTTVAPSGWQKTTVYLRKDQIRALKLAALDRGGTMSELLRCAIDRFLNLRDPVAEQVLRERLNLDSRHADAVGAGVTDDHRDDGQ